MMSQAHRIPAGGDKFQTLAVNRLKHDGCRRRAITTVFIKLPEHLAQQHCAHIGIGIGQVGDAPGDQAAFVQQLGRFVLQRLTDGDGAGDGTERRADRIDDQIDATLQAKGSIRLKDQAFGAIPTPPPAPSPKHQGGEMVDVSPQHFGGTEGG